MVMAIVEARAGEYDSALDRFDYVLSIPSVLSVNLLKEMDIPKELKEDPRFVALIERGDKVF